MNETETRIARELFRTLNQLIIRCDGEEGVRADGSNIDTAREHAVIQKLEKELFGCENCGELFDDHKLISDEYGERYVCDTDDAGDDFKVQLESIIKPEFASNPTRQQCTKCFCQWTAGISICLGCRTDQVGYWKAKYLEARRTGYQEGLEEGREHSDACKNGGLCGKCSS